MNNVMLAKFKPAVFQYITKLVQDSESYEVESA
jgi:hypothetical protein